MFYGKYFVPYIRGLFEFSYNFNIYDLFLVLLFFLFLYFLGRFLDEDRF